MIVCYFCKTAFSNNLGGQLTLHLNQVHNLSLADHYISSVLLGIEPKCACQLCNERPEFVRGAFKKYAKFHNRFDVREKLWRERYGDPKCVHCDNEPIFSRGIPKKYCSITCAMTGKGFGNPVVQQKIIITTHARYNVNCILQRPDIAAKTVEINSIRVRESLSIEHRQRISTSIKLLWQNPTYRIKTSASISAGTSTPKERLRRSLKMKNNRSDQVFLNKLWNACKNRLTKMHVCKRNKLALDELGFISEQNICQYWVDELNEDKKLIIEFNGDYTHANPKFYSPGDIIRLKGQQYTAAEKWALDAKRLQDLKEKGYNVIVVWESDDINEVKNNLSIMMHS